MENQDLLQKALSLAHHFMEVLGEPTPQSETDYLHFVSNRNTELHEGWNKNRFFLTFNLKKNMIEHSGGLKMVMGWSEDIPLQQFFMKVHPNYISAWLSWSMAIYELAAEMKKDIQIKHQAFQYRLPMLHANGRYFWCSAKCVSLRLDDSHNLVVHGNMYERHEELTAFNHQLFEPFLVEQLYFMDKWNTRLRQKMKPFVINSLNTNELKVMRHSLENLRTEQIAEIMNISKNTVMAYKKNILRQGQSVSGRVFRDADEVGRHFREMGWI